MTKLLFIFIVYFFAMHSLLNTLDLLVGMPINLSLYQALIPFEITDPAELVTLIMLAVIIFAIPLHYYFKPFISKFMRDD